MYRFTEFDNLDIRGGDDIDDVSTLQSQSSVIQTTDAYFNFRGTEEAPPRPTVIPVRRTLWSDDCANFAQVFEDIRAKNGVFGRLWRTWLDTGRRDWIYATLESISGTRTLRDYDTLPITMRYEVSGTVWSGFPWGRYAYPAGVNDDYDPEFPPDINRDNVFNLASVAPTHTVVNEGNATVRSVLVTVLVTAQTVAATSLTVNNTTTNSGFSINLAIPLNETWRIDGGQKRAFNSQTDTTLYPYFGYVGASSYWLTLAPGNNLITVTTPSFAGTGTITFSYYDGYK